MDAVLLKMILMALGMLLVPAAIARLIRLDVTFAEKEKNERYVGGSCCVSGLASFSKDLTTSPGDAKAPPR